MPTLDRERDRLVVTVVYDGPAFAGKTTNLVRLCEFFTPRKRSQLYVPEQRLGRTLYFDWLELGGGLVSGHPLVCRLVTVPGQEVLSRRRKHLLSLADAIVFVCDSSPEGVSDAKPMLTGLKRLARAGSHGGLPLVVQANKQDASEALPPHGVARRLGLDPAVRVIGARATDGAGVRETVVLAIRAAAERARRVLAEEGDGALLATVLEADDVYGALREQDERDAGEANLSVAEHREVLRSLALGSKADEAIESPVPALPPLPGADVPSGHIWPAATGRDALRRVPVKSARLRSEQKHAEDLAKGGGDCDLIVYEAGMWCLKTARAWRFGTLEQARELLLRMARNKTLLGPLLVPRTVLSLQQDTEGDYWLWTTMPWLETLQARCDHAQKHEDERLLAEALELFARSVHHALEFVDQSHTFLDLRPKNFAAVGQRVFYLDDQVSQERPLPRLGDSILACFDEYASWPGALEAYLRGLVAVVTRLSSDSPGRLNLLMAVEGAEARCEGARRARRTLLEAARGPEASLG